MDKQFATRLITDTFTQPFDENRYQFFIRNLFNHIDENKAFSYSGQYIPDAFKESIRQYKRVGTYTDPDGMVVDVMIVYLRRENALDHARTMQRNFITHYLKNRGQKETAVVAYVGETPDDWRFSLVRIDYRTSVKEDGRIKVEEDLTPARRFSFLVGKNEPNHTAQQQLFPILVDSQNDPSLEQLESAFNIESITKEFFEKYKNLFLQLKDELDTIAGQDKNVRDEFLRCQIDTAAFAKKLLGQIVFLYFLQKKGWLGVQQDRPWGTGSKNFLFDLFQKKYAPYKNYFNDILEPLFYEGLAIERVNNEFIPLNCKIPFLNGGLFEPVGGYDWRETDILIQNSIFQEVFETFNLYNFTVREDEPMEREVAVDPEMLGKVFENLLEVKDRKSKGAFYTPREIVHYMCEEALINYIDTALNSKQETSHSSFEINKPVVSREDIRIFINQGTVAANYDSAKESGTTSYTWRLPDNIRFYANEIDSALNNIKICDPAIGSGAFPVGIMTEIVKAREVLSTYLPENPARTTYNFKRHAIENSIYGVDIDSSAIDIARLRLWLSLVVDEQDYQYIKPLPNLDYRIVCGNSLVSFPDNWGSPIEKEIEGLIHLHINEANANKKKMLKDKIDEKLQTRYKNSLRAFGYEVNFDFKSIFSEVFRYKQGFDVILANPPYIQLSKVEGVPDWYKKYLKTRFNTSGGRLNTFIFFIHMAINNLNHKGNLAFIIPNTILTQEYYSATRELILKNNRLRTVVQYSELPFESAVVENVTILLSKETLDDYEIKLFTDDLFRRHLIGIASNKKFLNNKNFTITINQDEIVDKVFSVCKYSLDDYCEINQAIALKGDRSLSLRTENPQGLFYKKLDGKNIGKYSIIWDGVFLEYDLERIHSCKRKDIFLSNEKLFFRRVSEDLMFAYDNEQYFALNTLVVVNVKPGLSVNIKYLLAILNSKLINYVYKRKFKSTKTVFSEIQANTVGQLPILVSDSEQTMSTLISLVDKIINLKRANSKANTVDLEEKIDKIVYELYKLDTEDIEAIDKP